MKLNRVVKVNGVGCKVNLNNEALRLYGDELVPNPLLNANKCDEFVSKLALELGVDWTWGGLGEDRSWLWRESYIEHTGRSIHAGIDVNVPAGTAIVIPFAATVRLVDDDTPEIHGWGPRVAVIPDHAPKIVLLLAHLQAVSVCNNQRLSAGMQIAEVGSAPLNGGWYSHAHLQAVLRTFYEHALKAEPDRLDGYYRPDEAGFFERIYHDPLTLL